MAALNFWHCYEPYASNISLSYKRLHVGTSVKRDTSDLDVIPDSLANADLEDEARAYCGRVLHVAVLERSGHEALSSTLELGSGELTTARQQR